MQWRKRVRLLVNFLEHVVWVLPKFGLSPTLVEGDGRRFALSAIQPLNGQAICAVGGDVPVFKDDDAIRVFHEGLRVGSHDEAVVRLAEHQGAAVARTDEFIVVEEQGADAPCAAQALQCSSHGGDGRLPLFHGTLETVSDDFRVGFGAERCTVSLEVSTDSSGVFDDPIVDDDHPLFRAEVRVSVFVGDAAMGGPTGVGNADGPWHLLRERRFQFCDLSDSLADVESIATEGQARAVVAPVLQTAESVEQNWSRLPPAVVSNDATHASHLHVLATNRARHRSKPEVPNGEGRLA